jgi:hypothetical protein
MRAGESCGEKRRLAAKGPIPPRWSTVKGEGDEGDVVGEPHHVCCDSKNPVLRRYMSEVFIESHLE